LTVAPLPEVSHRHGWRPGSTGRRRGGRRGSLSPRPPAARPVEGATRIRAEPSLRSADRTDRPRSGAPEEAPRRGHRVTREPVQRRVEDRGRHRRPHPHRRAHRAARPLGAGPPVRRARDRRARCRLCRRLRPPPRRPDRRRAPPGSGRRRPRAVGVTTPHPGARDVTTARRRVGASIASTYVCWTWVGVAALAGAALEHPPGPDVPPPPRGAQWGFEALAVVSLAVALCHLVVVVALPAGRPRVPRAGTITAALGGALAAAHAAPATGSATLALGAVLGLVGEITLLYVLLPRSPAAARRQAPTVPPPGHPSSGEVPWEKGLDIVGAMATVVGSVTMALAGLG